jgi:hypothetical protein
MTAYAIEISSQRERTCKIGRKPGQDARHKDLTQMISACQFHQLARSILTPSLRVQHKMNVPESSLLSVLCRRLTGERIAEPTAPETLRG